LANGLKFTFKMNVAQKYIIFFNVF